MCLLRQFISEYYIRAQFRALEGVPLPATVLVKVLERLRPIRMYLQREKERVEKKKGGGERGVKEEEEEEGKEAGREERD